MFLAGQQVQITPKNAEARKFWAFVDGWCGRVEGMNTGRVVVVCQRDDGPKTLFVEPDNLTTLHNFGRT